MKNSVKTQIENLKNEILNDTIAWKKVFDNGEKMKFDFFDKQKHTHGYSTIEVTILHDGENAFVTTGSGYYKTFAELKEKENLNIGEEFTKTYAGGTNYIKIY